MTLQQSVRVALGLYASFTARPPSVVPQAPRRTAIEVWFASNGTFHLVRLTPRPRRRPQ